MTPTRTAGDEFAELFGGQNVNIYTDGDCDAEFTGRVLGSRCTDRWIALAEVACGPNAPPTDFVLVDRITRIEMYDPDA